MTFLLLPRLYNVESVICHPTAFHDLIEDKSGYEENKVFSSRNIRKYPGHIPSGKPHKIRTEEDELDLYGFILGARCGVGHGEWIADSGGRESTCARGL